MASGPITSWQINGETMETVTTSFLVGSAMLVKLTQLILLGRWKSQFVVYTDFHSVTTSTTLISSYKISGSLSRDAHSLTLCLSLKDNRKKLSSIKGFSRSSVSKESACNAGDPGLIPGSGRSPGEGVFLPGKSHGQRSLVGYSQWGCKSQTRLSD